jgi:hypothetical protein
MYQTIKKYGVIMRNFRKKAHEVLKINENKLNIIEVQEDEQVSAQGFLLEFSNYMDVLQEVHDFLLVLRASPPR